MNSSAITAQLAQVSNKPKNDDDTVSEVENTAQNLRSPENESQANNTNKRKKRKRRLDTNEDLHNNNLITQAQILQTPQPTTRIYNSGYAFQNTITRLNSEKLEDAKKIGDLVHLVTSLRTENQLIADKLIQAYKDAQTSQVEHKKLAAVHSQFMVRYNDLLKSYNQLALLVYLLKQNTDSQQTLFSQYAQAYNFNASQPILNLIQNNNEQTNQFNSMQLSRP